MKATPNSPRVWLATLAIVIYGTWGSHPLFAGRVQKALPIVGPQATATTDSDCYSWTRVAPAPASLSTYNAAATSDGRSAYLAGGFVAGGYTRDIANGFARYDRASNTWTVLASMLDANAAASAVYSPINNKVYVFGGRSSFDTTAVSGASRVYDVATNSWSHGAGMPAPRYQMAAGYHNGKIYLAGGTSTNNSAQTNLWEYDPIANTWNASRLSIPLAAAGSYFGIINGHFYLAGGFPSSSGGKISYDYDIAHDSWTRRADLLHNHSVVSSAVADGRLRIIGGFYDTEAGDIGESYDPRSDTWSEEPSFTKQSLAATAIGATLFAAGGIQYVGMGAFVSNRIARVSTCAKECDTSSWGLKTSYPFAVESPAVGSDGMFAYVAGGLASGVATNRFFRSDATGDAWIEMPPLPAAVHSGRGVYAPNTQAFYVFGGRNNSNVLNTVYKYSFATNSWSNGAAMPAERYFANVAYSKVTGKIYVIGGFDSSNAEAKQRGNMIH